MNRHPFCENLRASKTGSKLGWMGQSNRSDIGARVLVRYGGRVQAQAGLSQASFYSCNDPPLHYGLGTFNSVDIEVFWPNGLLQGGRGESIGDPG
jgi:hypothetical protein